MHEREKPLQARVKSMDQRSLATRVPNGFVDLKTCQMNTRKQCSAACRAACTGQHLAFILVMGVEIAFVQPHAKALLPWCPPAAESSLPKPLPAAVTGLNLWLTTLTNEE